MAKGVSAADEIDSPNGASLICPPPSSLPPSLPAVPDDETLGPPAEVQWRVQDIGASAVIFQLARPTDQPAKCCFARPLGLPQAIDICIEFQPGKGEGRPWALPLIAPLLSPVV